MPNRRKVLIGLGTTGLISISGCLSETDCNHDPDTPTAREVMPDPSETPIEEDDIQSSWSRLFGFDDGIIANWEGPDNEEYELEILRYCTEEDAKDDIFVSDYDIFLAHDIFAFGVNGPDERYIKNILAKSPILSYGIIELKAVNNRPTQTPTKTVESTPEPETANFEITRIGESGYVNYHPQNPDVDFSATVENTGEEQGTQIIELQVQDITTIEEELTLDGGEAGEIAFSANFDDGEDDTYRYSYHTEDDERFGGDVFIFECPSESDLPDYEAVGSENLTYEDIKRINFDIMLADDGENYTDAELISITKRAVCISTEEEGWNAVGTTIWEPDQIPGYEQAYGECNWAPNGMWSQAGEEETGYYSQHEYSVRRF